jgi:hypothetical protein
MKTMPKPKKPTCLAIEMNVEFMPFRFEYEDETQPLVHVEWLQFPFRLAFSMTIIKVQGQTLHRCGINLSEPCFAHGQLFVALSRATKMTGVKRLSFHLSLRPKRIKLTPKLRRRFMRLDLRLRCLSKWVSWASFSCT